MAKGNSIPPKTKRFVSVIVVACVGIASTFLWFTWENALLTRRATRLERLPYRFVRYYWRSDNTFVIASLIPAAPTQPLVEVDTRTGSHVVLDAFDKCAGSTVNYFNFTVSPDGAKALWGSVNVGVTSLRMDGSLRIERKFNDQEFWTDASNAVWLPDSRRWVQLLGGKHGLSAVVEGLDTPGILKKVIIGMPKGTGGGHGLMQTHLLGATKTGRILATPQEYDEYHSRGAYRKINFFEFAIDGGPARLRQYTIDLPKAGPGYENGVALSDGEEVVLSPHGDQLAWIVHTRQEQPRLIRWLAQWIPALRHSPRLHTEIRTSRLDGTDVHVVGYIMHEDNVNWNEPGKLFWLPGTKDLSFIYDGFLWKIPAR